MDEGGRGEKSYPAHLLKLMLQVSGQNTQQDNDSCFKAQLIALVLECRDKGQDLSNVKKRCKQVWPMEAFPEYDNNKGSTAKQGLLSDFWLIGRGKLL
jgi:hypothetical protein